MLLTSYTEDGPDVRFNASLASAIAIAKKQGLPKASIESAIARGQGKSSSGAPLVLLTIEAVVPPSVGVILECETSNKAQTLQDVKLLLKDVGGSASPSGHLFDRRGRVVLENPEGLGEDDVLDTAVDAGVVDLKVDEEGNFEFFTEPNETTLVMKNLVEGLKMNVLSSELAWVPKAETMVHAAESESFSTFMGACSSHEVLMLSADDSQLG